MLLQNSFPPLEAIVYAIDSHTGEILVMDMHTGTEMSRCGIPVEPVGVS